MAFASLESKVPICQGGLHNNFEILSCQINGVQPLAESYNKDFDSFLPELLHMDLVKFQVTIMNY